MAERIHCLGSFVCSGRYYSQLSSVVYLDVVRLKVVLALVIGMPVAVFAVVVPELAGVAERHLMDWLLAADTCERRQELAALPGRQSVSVPAERQRSLVLAAGLAGAAIVAAAAAEAAAVG